MNSFPMYVLAHYFLSSLKFLVQYIKKNLSINSLQSFFWFCKLIIVWKYFLHFFMVLLWSTKVFLPSSKHCYIKRTVPGTQKHIEVWNSIFLNMSFGLIITTSVQHFDVNLASTWRLSSTNVRTLVTSFDQRHFLFAMHL